MNDSITPLLDYYRSPKQVESKKYSKTQYEAILEAFKQKDSSFRVVSYNMLFDRYDHLLAKPYRWNARLPRVLDLIDEMHSDIVCMQELYPNQVQDILKDIGHEYGFAGKLPEPGQEPTEINGILYRKTRFSCESCRVYYISETPDVLSSDPYSKERRTLVEAQLTDLKTKKELVVFCTQIAFGSADSREYAANYIIKHIEPICQKKACILAGDFNCFSPHLDDPHVPFCDGTFIMRLLTGKYLQNSRDAALIGTIGPLSTYTNLPGAILPFQGRGTPGIILDHILVTSNIQVLISAIQPGQVDGMYGSDHLPVIADCIAK
ncbi:MAG: endonuclease/exonuclease/phosphatase family protein [Chlamydiales bacterium]|nr:endonuclease/exonuclease/phosphatase family protein [Chlamydiales bacterium]